MRPYSEPALPIADLATTPVLDSVREVHEYWTVDSETRGIELHRKRKDGAP